jgi:hypothetical protein
MESMLEQQRLSSIIGYTNGRNDLRLLAHGHVSMTYPVG